MSFSWQLLVGTYRLEVTEELLRFIELAFVNPAPQPERVAARRHALDEAEGAEIELTTRGELVSRSRGLEFFRTTVASPGDSVEELRFEKAPGVPVRLELVDESTLIAHQQGRPETRFRR